MGLFTLVAEPGCSSFGSLDLVAARAKDPTRAFATILISSSTVAALTILTGSSCRLE